MKILLLLLPLLLVGCADYAPMSDAEATAFLGCLAKDKTPAFFVGGARRLDCT